MSAPRRSYRTFAVSAPDGPPLSDEEREVMGRRFGAAKARMAMKVKAA